MYLHTYYAATVGGDWMRTDGYRFSRVFFNSQPGIESNKEESKIKTQFW